MNPLPVPPSEIKNPESCVIREMDARRRLNYEFYDQLDCMDLSTLPSYLGEEIEGAD